MRGDDALPRRGGFFQHGLRQLDVQVTVLLNGAEHGFRQVVQERQLRFHMRPGGRGDDLRKWVHGIPWK
jgi:hypothetical protein